MADKKQKLASPHYIGGAVGLIIILIIAGYLMYAKQVSSPVVGNHTDTAKENVGDNPLVVDDQAAGESVAIRAMDLPEGSWIAIKEKSSGRILGAARFPAGATSGEVELLRATVAGGAYEVVVYADDGDKAFDHKKDTLVESVSASFKTL